MSPEEATALRAEVVSLRHQNAVMRDALETIERRLRVGAAPLVPFLNAHAGPVEKAAWTSIYSSVIRAQLALFDPNQFESDQ